ncbi:PhzF family phenazine biosynthesis protein [Microbacterium sp. RURRCA19A]|uniref:PhzF family phenazine biosynthesis protein n=1 Tax=Microbacterium sp. RURRCA19A TaxID=1907391 RepID=UPI0009550621|nr:PhzF family phenazine biosynthesis protein [Microbacterium sp. RURRCA19A]SIR91321.1 phenazine biosynthesis protein PhzF family [Microbacterium sp. RURRCA19A]
MTEAPGILHLLAFAAEPGGGNPAGVVLDATTLDDADMLQIAAELGYPETAYVTARDGERLRVRYFSPEAEVPFCGHATIATAVALAESAGPGEFVFETAAGDVEVSARDEGGRIAAGFTSVEPTVRDFDDPAPLLALLGLDADDLDPRMPLAEAFAGNWHPVVAVRSLERFDGFGFDPDAMRELMAERGWTGTVTVVHAAGDIADGAIVEARNLFPVGDITEDPATGSAAAALGAYLRDRLGMPTPFHVTVHQGRHIGRPSILEVDAPPVGGIRVSGTAVPLEG